MPLLQWLLSLRLVLLLCVLLLLPARAAHLQLLCALLLLWARLLPGVSLLLHSITLQQQRSPNSLDALQHGLQGVQVRAPGGASTGCCC